MGNVFGGGNADEEEEEDDERLRRWRPALEPLQYGALKRKKISSKSSDSSDDGSGSDGQSISSSGSKFESESEKSEDGEKSDDGSAKDEDSGDGTSDEDDGKQALAKKDDKKKKIVVRMEFEPLLSLHEPLAEEMEPPNEIFTHQKKRRKAERAERAALEDAMTQNRRKAKMAAEWMADMGLEEVSLKELAQALGEDADELRYALVQSRRFTVNDDGLVRRALLQRILDVMESDIETLQEVVDKLMDSDADSVKAAINGSHGELRLKLANDIELVEHVDIEAELKLQREEEREQRAKEKDERRREKMRKNKKGKGAVEDEEEESSESSSDEEGRGISKEAEKKALAFRRLQVQRKIEEFLKIYTRGQNLTKINSKGQRYHRRVYVDTSRRALVVQGANGPKFFLFASMKEVDIETRTTKEGRVETLVICAIEKRGRIVKELCLAFPDQARANTFVNCVTLFSLALRHASQK